MRILLILIFASSTIGVWAQTDVITLSNPSFEDTPRKGGQVNGIKGWYDCGILNFPEESAPDIHPQDFWENTKQASHKETYLGMVVRDNETYESVSQRMSSSMKAGQCYSFSMELSRSSKYLSGSRFALENNGDKSQNYSYTTPAVIRVWGGLGYCDTKELLAETVPVRHSEWKTYPFKLSPSFNHKVITIEVYYKVPVLIPYNGHVLVDNCSDIVQISCNEEIVAQVEVVQKSKIPPHKRFKKKKVKKEESTNKDNSEVASTRAPAPKIMNLDRSKMRKDQTIEIKNLYFKSDVTSINSKSYEVLNEIFDFLVVNDDITIEIGGHTNNLPSHDYCDKLSEERAKEVAVYLVEKGINGDRIFYRGYGKRKSIASNLSVEGRKKNQRVEIKILSIG
jgi:outer membrane protein OmpA-like peptidoglycan-associated protein